MKPPVLVLRPEHGAAVGAGHLGRAVALAQAWRDHHGHVVAVVGDAPQFWRRRFQDEGAEIVSQEVDVEPSTSVVVTDGYGLGAAGLAYAVRGRVDDFGLSVIEPEVDIVIDQSGASVPASYRAARRLLLGPRYAMLRREFRTLPRARGQARSSVVVAIGGVPAARLQDWAREVVARLPEAEVLWLQGVADVSGVLERSSVALATAGSTAWELCRWGIPGAYVALNHNQRLLLERIGELGFGVPLGPLDEVDPEVAAKAVRSLLEEGGAERAVPTSLVDGMGALRVTTALRGQLLEVRRVQLVDRTRLFEWANDRDTRRAAKNQAPIAWDEHVAWFEERHDPCTATGPSYLVEYGGSPLGHFRVDIGAGDEGVVSVTVAPEWRGRGWAGALIDAASTTAFAELPDVRTLVAEIRTSNVASQRAFRAADFDEMQSGGPAPGGEGMFVAYARRRAQA